MTDTNNTLGAIVAVALGARTPLLPQESVVLDLERTRMALEDLRGQQAAAAAAAAAADERMRMVDMVDEIMDIIRSAQATISEALEPVDAPATRGRDALRTLNDDMENIIDILTLEFETELDAVHDSDDDDDDA